MLMDTVMAMMRVRVRDRVHPNTNPNLTLSLRPILTSVIAGHRATCTYERDWCDGDKRWW